MPNEPLSGNESWFRNFLPPQVRDNPGYSIATPEGITTKVDQNEMPFDWPSDVKKRICERVMNRWSWNRYPADYPRDLEARLAEQVGVDPECVLTSPGSNHLIAMAMDAFCAHCKGEVWIARPSFPLYEEHARFYAIPYQAWSLTSDFRYDTERLNELPDHSVVLFASPNNPTGCSLTRATLDRVLTTHQSSLFIADEAYFEFSEEPYTKLLERHGNLLIIRTFSKTLAAASLRLGYAVGSSYGIGQLRKLMLPYLINPFTNEAATAAICDDEMRSFLRNSVELIKKERNDQFHALSEIGTKLNFRVHNSDGNFLMLQWNDASKLAMFTKKLVESGCLARDISRGPGLAGCIRISIGSPGENEIVRRVAKNLLDAG